MPSYDYVNQGTGSTNRPPIVSNPRDGEMTHCIWYVPNQTGTGAWNEFGDLGSTGGTSLPTNFRLLGQIALKLVWYMEFNSMYRVIEFGVLGRHHHSATY